MFLRLAGKIFILKLLLTVSRFYALLSHANKDTINQTSNLAFIKTFL